MRRRNKTYFERDAELLSAFRIAGFTVFWGSGLAFFSSFNLFLVRDTGHRAMLT